ncbi:MAG TPA: hypothetical protein PKH10_00425 [bacterium]|nr:hypothetical protein [bacterium]
MDKEALVKAFHVDNEALVKGLHATIESLKKKGRDFFLVMLVPFEPTSNDLRLALLISASWLDNLSPKEALDEIIQEFLNVHANKGPETDSFFKKVGRITIIKSTDPFVNALTSAISVSDRATAYIGEGNINGVLIKQAIILAARNPRQKKSDKKDAIPRKLK